jgi:hypothetical protein
MPHKPYLKLWQEHEIREFDPHHNVPETETIAAAADDGDLVTALRYAIPISIGLWVALLVALRAVF